MDRNNVGVFELPGDPSLVEKTALELRVAADLREQHLEGNLTTNFSIGGAQDAAHPALIDQLHVLLTDRWHDEEAPAADMGQVSEAPPQSDDAQADLETLKARDVLVEVRTKLVNHVRAVLKSFGIRVKGRAGDTFPEKVLEVTPESLRPGILALLDTYREVSTKIKSLTKAAERLCEEKYKKETELLQQINGVGPIVSLNFDWNIAAWIWKTKALAKGLSRKNKWKYTYNK